MWETDITDSELITEDKADFLLAEAKEQIAGTILDAEALSKTGVLLLGGSVTLSAALWGSRFGATPLIHSQVLSGG